MSNPDSSRELRPQSRICRTRYYRVISMDEPQRTNSRAPGSTLFFFFSSRRRHTRSDRDWSSDVCSPDLERVGGADRDHLEKTGAERDARQELAHHGRLAQALERLAGEFPGEQHDREHREKASDVDPAGRPEDKEQACGQGPRGRAKAAASPWDGS